MRDHCEWGLGIRTTQYLLLPPAGPLILSKGEEVKTSTSDSRAGSGREGFLRGWEGTLA